MLAMLLPMISAKRDGHARHRDDFDMSLISKLAVALVVVFLGLGCRPWPAFLSALQIGQAVYDRGTAKAAAAVLLVSRWWLGTGWALFVGRADSTRPPANRGPCQFACPCPAVWVQVTPARNADERGQLRPELVGASYTLLLAKTAKVRCEATAERTADALSG